jgi:hypothetical protein
LIYRNLTNRPASGVGAGSVTSNEVSVVSANALAAINIVSNAVSALEVRVSALSASPAGVSVTSGELSAVSAQAASAIASEISNRTSADNALSAAIAVVSNSASAADVHASVASLAATSADAHASVASLAATSADGHANAASGAATSVNSRVTSVNTFLCALSVKTSAAGTSVHGLQSILDAISQRISVEAPLGGGGGSVTSAEVQVASAAATSADAHAATASLAATSADGHAATASLAATSVDGRVNSVNTFLSGISARSIGDVSTHGLQSVVNALSAQVAAAGGGSVTSAEVVAAHGLYVLRSGTVSVVSAATLTNIQSMVLTLEAGGHYQVEGALAFECGTSGGFGFGVSLPALIGSVGSYMYVRHTSSQSPQNANVQGGWTQFSAAAAGQTVLVSISIAAINNLRHFQFDGFIAVSTAGTMQMMAKTSVANASMSVRGGFIRAFKLS